MERRAKDVIARDRDRDRGIERDSDRARDRARDIDSGRARARDSDRARDIDRERQTDLNLELETAGPQQGLVQHVNAVGHTCQVRVTDRPHSATDYHSLLLLP